jgi:rubrerythrin
VPVEYATWIGISDGVADGKPVYDRWECSECGYYAGEEKPKWSFCPNCGKPIWKGEL